MLDPNDLAMFVYVVRAGSFSEAARRLRMPANTMGRRIDQLEGKLGARLLHRSTRQARTERGRLGAVRTLCGGARADLRDRTAQRR